MLITLTIQQSDKERSKILVNTDHIVVIRKNKRKIEGEPETYVKMSIEVYSHPGDRNGFYVFETIEEIEKLICR